MSSSNFVPSAILAVGIALSGFFVSRGIITFKMLNRVVDVRGLDERLVDSTEASWMITYVVQGNQLAEIYKKSSDAEKNIREFLQKLNFKDEEIILGVLNTMDMYLNNYSNNKPAFRYSGRVTLTVASKNVGQVEKAQKLSSELVAKDIQVEGNYIRYFYNDLNKIKPEMLKNASLSAREAATSFAKDTGATIGDIQKASQGLFTIDAPYSQEGQESSRQKRVRVVTQVSYYLE